MAKYFRTIPTILYKQEIELKFQAILLFVRTFSLIIGVLIIDDLYFSLALFSIGSSLVLIFYLKYIFKLSKIKMNQIILSCLDNKYEYLLLLLIVLLMYFLIETPIFTLAFFIPLLIYVLYSVLAEIKKV